MKAAWRRSLKTLSLAPSLPSAAANHLIRKLGRLGAGQRLRYPHHAQGCDRTLARAASLSAGLDEGLATSNPRPSNSDTIFALSTAPGRAAIAVIRLSGSACLQVYRSLCPGRALPRVRTATIRKLYDPAASNTTHSLLDSAALLLFFRAPNTVTGEDVLELHTHGGPAIVKAVLNAIRLCGRTTSENQVIHTIRYAEPGEFTQRAFYNGRLDLTQIEALGDSLSAETEQQRRLAVSGTGNELGTRYEKWRNLLLSARGELEALIDFSEDQHFDESPAELMSSVSEQVVALNREISLHIQNASKGELVRNGISIALLGAPNAGKSSLLNSIVGREAAIVSSEQGTTRDIVDVSVDIGGWLCRLGDMAGLRKAGQHNGSAQSLTSVGPVEEEGIRRAKARALASDLVVVMMSVEKSADSHTATLNVDEELVLAARECEALGKAMIVVVNKTDNLRSGVAQELEAQLYAELKTLFPLIPREHVFLISCLNATNPSPTDDDPGNIQKLLQGLQSYFTALTAASSPSEHVFDKSYWEECLSVSHRQSEYLQQCHHHLDDFLSQALSQHHSDDRQDLVPEVDIVTAAEHLRSAANCLAKITGRGEAGEVEDVLGVVFEK